MQTVGANLEIGNDKFTLRVPVVTNRTFSTPVGFSLAPTPLAGVKHAGGSWYGGSHFVSERLLSSYTFSIVEQGKASITYQARYRFSPQGEYSCRIQVTDTLPYPVFTEEFDFGSMTDGHDFLVLDLTTGWSPNTYRYIECAFGGGESPFATGGIYTSGLSSYITTKTTAWNNPAATDPPHAYQPGSSALVLLDRLTHTGSFGPRGAVGLSSASQTTTVLPMHGGAWRRGMALTCWNDPASGIKMALPISARPMDTYLEVCGDRDPFATMTHDSALPTSYGYRIWALCCNLGDTAVASVHSQAGVIGLDRYKNWILSWNYDSSKTFPRAWTTPALVTRLKNTINSHPDKARMQGRYLISGNASDATTSANLVIGRFNPGNYQQVWAFTGYRDAENYQMMILAEDALSCSSLSSSLRDQLRLWLALTAYYCAEPDLSELGTGAHLGTWNMRFGRIVGGTYVAALLPYHPSYNYWMTHYRDIDNYLLATTVTPVGGWYEPPLYSMYGPERWISVAQQILRNTGLIDLNANGYLSKFLQYNADITMADPRYPAHRILPGMGDGGNTLEAMFGIGIGPVENSDPVGARFFNYMHGLNSINGLIARSDWGCPDYSFMYFPTWVRNPGRWSPNLSPASGFASARIAMIRMKPPCCSVAAIPAVTGAWMI